MPGAPDGSLNGLVSFPVKETVAKEKVWLSPLEDYGKRKFFARGICWGSGYETGNLTLDRSVVKGMLS